MKISKVLRLFVSEAIIYSDVVLTFGKLVLAFIDFLCLQTLHCINYITQLQILLITSNFELDVSHRDFI